MNNRRVGCSQPTIGPSPTNVAGVVGCKQPTLRAIAKHSQRSISVDGALRIMGKLSSIGERVTCVIQRRFPSNTVALEHFGSLLVEYAEAGIGPPHFVSELETSDEGKLRSCIWEAMLYRHLRQHGYEPRGTTTRGGQNGPDFRIEHDGRTIWMEAVVPAPGGIPEAYLRRVGPGDKIRVKKKPDHERVLRCTSVIRDKQRKLDRYREIGIIGDEDCVVLAVNICRLSDWDPDGNGISQYPLAMEAVLPVGPLEIRRSPEGAIAPSAHNVSRYSVKKTDGTEIETANFFNPDFARVSAVLQAHQDNMHERKLILAIIHNPCASNKLPLGLFGACREFVATEQEDMFHVQDRCIDL